MAGLLDRAFELTDYHEKTQRFARENAEKDNGLRGSSPTVREGLPISAAGGSRRVRKGIGFASFMHGAGFTGSGEVYLASVVGAEATAEGRIRILAASTEIGQGTNTIFSQIAAEALSVDESLIEVAQPDTSEVPNSGPTVASRTCMVVGKLVRVGGAGSKTNALRQRTVAGKLRFSHNFRRRAGNTSRPLVR
jgi:CO/xanthine dehydrogenase Mo-binding subunit